MIIASCTEELNCPTDSYVGPDCKCYCASGNDEVPVYDCTYGESGSSIMLDVKSMMLGMIEYNTQCHMPGFRDIIVLIVRLL